MGESVGVGVGEREPLALLGATDPPPVSVTGEGGRDDLLIVGDHAGNAVPASLGDLGLTLADRARHIAWDIGVRAMGERLSAALGATFVHQPYSRLVIDCNRDPRSAQSILPVSDETPIPGNAGLAPSDRHRRRVAIHEPYHLRIRDELERRRAAGARPVLFALHSFVPAMGGRPRPWHVGVLHDVGDTRLSRAMLARLREEEGLTVGDNEPYRMDETDYTIGRHANPGGLPYLELEMRQDLLFDDEAAGRWAARCARWLENALSKAL